MSEQESLRLAAELVDNFSPTMRKLRSNMQDFAKAGAEHSEAVAKGFNRVEAGMKTAAGTASSVLTPALATVGITGLSLTATIAGIGSAIKDFGSRAKDLGQLGRDTGIAANRLREVQGVLGAVGVDAGTSAQAIQQFAENARLARNGVGPLIEFLNRQGRTAEGRAYFQSLARDIRNSKDAGEALDKALRGMEGIKDPVDRRKYAQEVLGMGDAARLLDGRLGSLREQFERFRRNNGVVSEQDIKDAEAYARAMDGLKGTVNKLYDAVARELTPTLTEAAKAVKALMDNERNGVQSALVQGIKDIKRELSDINWKQAGQDALSFFKDTTALAGSLASSLKYIVGVLHELNKGDYVEALRKSTGGGGTVGRAINQLYPREQKLTPTDEALDAQMRGQTLTPEQLQGNRNLRSAGPRVAEIEARQAEIRQKLAQADLLEKGGTASERSREAAEALRREMSRLTDELRRIREGSSSSGGATVQQQSFSGTGTGLGGLIHTAAFGGGLPAVRAMLRSGQGIYAPGGGGYGGPGPLAGDAGGGYDRLTGGGGGADIGGGMRGTPFGKPHPDSPAGRIGAQLRGGRPYSGKLNLADADPKVVAYIREAAKARGIDADTALAVADGEGLRGFRPDRAVKGDGGTSHGPFQLHYAGGTGRNRQPGLGDDFTRSTGLDARDPATWQRQVDFALDNVRSKGWRPFYGRQHHGIGIWDGIGGRTGFGGGGTERMGLGGNAATGRSPMDGVDSRLKDILARASGELPEGYTAKFESGVRRGDPRFHGQGLATDIAIYDKSGRRLNNYQDGSTFRNYEQYAQAARRIQMERYPELNRAFRWGGYFGGARGKYGAVDTMHFDLGGERVGMGGGSWEGGLTDGQRRLFPDAQSEGMGAYNPQRWRDRMAEEKRRGESMQLDPRARGAGRFGLGGVQVDGAVHVNVQTTDPRPKVTTGASGPLFREIRQNRGRQMGAAED